MKTNKLTRRRFINLGTKTIAFIPVMNSMSCLPNQNSVLNAEDSLKRILRIIGPWEAKDQSIADNFISRFLKSVMNTEPYLADSAEIVQNMASRLPNDQLKEVKIELYEIPNTEAILLESLVKHLYSFVEIRNYVINQPQIGICQGSPSWQTLAPL